MRTNKLPIKGDRYYSAEEIRSHVGIVGKWIIDSNSKPQNKGSRKDDLYALNDYLLFKNIEYIFWSSALVGIIVLIALWQLHNSANFLLVKPFVFSIYSRENIGFAAYYAYYHSLFIAIPILFVSFFHIYQFAKNAVPGKFNLFRHDRNYQKRELSKEQYASYIKGLGWILLCIGLMALLSGYNAIAMFVIWFHLPEAFGDSLLYTAISYIFLVLSHVTAGSSLFIGFLFIYASPRGFVPDETIS